MQLTDKHTTEFQELYKKHFGRDIDPKEALEKGVRLIRLIEIVSKHEAKSKDKLPDQTNINHYDNYKH